MRRFGSGGHVTGLTIRTKKLLLIHRGLTGKPDYKVSISPSTKHQENFFITIFFCCTGTGPGQHWPGTKQALAKFRTGTMQGTGIPLGKSSASQKARKADFRELQIQNRTHHAQKATWWDLKK